MTTTFPAASTPPLRDEPGGPGPAGERPGRTRPPDHLIVSQAPVLRRFWYAACLSGALGPDPVARTVLGTDLVIWRPGPDAPPAAALDRCPHRDAPLSRGWVSGCHLVCPYHGWEWDRDGRTRRIPQFPAARHPTRGGLSTVACQERYGIVWVCLEPDPVVGVPPLPEFGAPGWRVIPEREYAFDCTAMHLLENNFDPGHIAFVHRATFGNPDRAELTDSTVHREPFGLRVEGEVPVAARHGQGTPTVRRTTSSLYAPFVGHLHIGYPDGLRHVMFKAITPVDDRRCVLTQLVLRTDTEDERPAADVLAFDDAVEAEDRALLELLPTPYPLAPHHNAHAMADRAGLAIRRLWSELVTGRWSPTW